MKVRVLQLTASPTTTEQGYQVQVNKKCQTTCKKCQIASKDAKQAETGRMLLVFTFPDE